MSRSLREDHPSWWDPLVALVLSHRIGRQVMTAPIDARALRGYRFFERLGFFGIEPGTSQGWHTLLRVAGEVLARPDGALWITPQGEFTDARTPIELRGGVGAVVRHMQRGSVLPLALEYTFWDERLPEALARFGPAVVVADGRARSAEEWTQAIAAAMQANQLALAELSQARDPARFEQVLLGQAGVTRAYDLWRRLRAWMGRGPAATEHRALLEEGSR